MALADNKTRADAINARWTAVMAQYDAYFSSLPVDVRATLGKAVSNWQDFYYGVEDWSAVPPLDTWEVILNKAAQTLLAAVKPGTTPDTQTAATTQAKKSNADATFFVSGKLPEFTLPKWYILALGAVPACVLIFMGRRS